MHEMGIVLQIIKTANEYAEECHAKAVHKLTLQIGEASAIVPYYVETFWGDVVPDQPLLKDCALEIEYIPAKAFCMDCGHVFLPGAAQSARSKAGQHAPLLNACPECGSGAYKLIEGNTMMIKSMEIE